MAFLSYLKIQYIIFVKIQIDNYVHLGLIFTI
jgi:hypothetical protein